jgi:hypothetical protein
VSESALQQLEDAQAALVAALAVRDVDAIDAANAAVAVAVEEVRVAGGWNERPGLRDDLIRILKSAETARGQVNALADQNRRDLDKLVALGSTPRPTAYGRSGKLS